MVAARQRCADRQYSKADLDTSAAGSPEGSRKNVAPANGSLNARGLAIAEVVKEVAAELDRTPAQTALAWTLRNPAVTAPIIGARTPAQLADKLGALDVEFDAAQLDRLDAASAVEPGFPHNMLAREMTNTVINGDLTIAPRLISRCPARGRPPHRPPAPSPWIRRRW
ncbi:aldo/keto reductase [Nocardia africana]|uniref:aldo/keto reductase n=1 Tax=Nocardia africana TaxID=134964 RepID=UPI001D1359AB|nr:aldo/keto reductase [Nocardia africana]MCC3315395.1 aldo/keto reductase [Nocardia africana]